jgi:hypothetical protein
MVACRPVQQGVSPMCSPQPRQLVTFVFPYLLGGMGGRVNRVPCFNGLSPRETTATPVSPPLAPALFALLVRSRLVVVRFCHG